MLGGAFDKINDTISGWFEDSDLLDGQGVQRVDEPLIGLFPYRAFEEQSELFVNVNSCGFILEVPPLPGSSHETINQLTSAFSDNMADHSSLQILLWASPRVGDLFETWQAERGASPEVYRNIAAKRVEYFAESGWTSPLGGTNNLCRDYRVFVIGSLPGAIEKKRAILTAMKTSIRSALEGLGLPVKTLRPDDFINIMDEWLNPDTAPERPDLKWRSLDPLNHQLSQGDSTIAVYPDHLELGGQFDVRCMTVQSYPDAWAGWQNSQMIGSAYSDDQRVPCPFMLAFNVTVGSDTQDAQRAGFKAANSTRKADGDMAKYMPMIREQAAEWKYVAQKISDGHKLAWCFYQVIVFARKTPGGSAGDAGEQAVRSIYRANGWRLVRDRFVQHQSFLAAMPFMPSEGITRELARLGRCKTLLTWSCANLAPMRGEWKGMDVPLVMLIGKRGQPFFWDPFANPEGNYNVSVIGKSGSGKSVFMQELVASIAGANGQVIVIDDGYSFMNSCALQGGDFVAFSGEADICLNPYSIIDGEAFNRDSEYRESVLTMIGGLVQQMCRSKSETNDFENAHIGDAIKQAWDHKGCQAEINDIGQVLQSSDEPRVKDLGQMLSPHMRGGVYERYWNGQCTLKVGAHLTVFELSEIKNQKDLQGLVMMMLMFLASNTMYHSGRERRKALIIDEAWDLLHGAATKNFIEGLARRARKYNGCLITGTQSVNDYYKNDAALAAFENTDWTVFLAQKDDSINHLKTTGRIAIDDNMERDLKSLKMRDRQYSEALIYGPQGYGIGRLMMDPFSIQLFSSKGSDVAQIKQLQQQGMSLIEAVEALAQKGHQ